MPSWALASARVGCRIAEDGCMSAFRCNLDAFVCARSLCCRVLTLIASPKKRRQVLFTRKQVTLLPFAHSPRHTRMCVDDEGQKYEKDLLSTCGLRQQGQGAYVCVCVCVCHLCVRCTVYGRVDRYRCVGKHAALVLSAVLTHDDSRVRRWVCQEYRVCLCVYASLHACRRIMSSRACVRVCMCVCVPCNM